MAEDSGGVAPEGIELFQLLANKHDGGRLNPAHYGKSWTATNFMTHHGQRLSLAIQLVAAQEIRFQARLQPARTPYRGAPRYRRR